MTLYWSNRPADPGRRLEWIRMLRDTMPLQTITRPLHPGTSYDYRPAYIVVVGPIRSQPVERRER